MAAIVANKVKRERQLRESKASIDTSQQLLHQRGSCNGRELLDQDNLQLQTKGQNILSACKWLAILLIFWCPMDFHVKFDHFIAQINQDN